MTQLDSISFDYSRSEIYLNYGIDSPLYFGFVDHEGKEIEGWKRISFSTKTLDREAPLLKYIPWRKNHATVRYPTWNTYTPDWLIKAFGDGDVFFERHPENPDASRVKLYDALRGHDATNVSVTDFIVYQAFEKDPVYGITNPFIYLLDEAAFNHRFKGMP